MYRQATSVVIICLFTEQVEHLGVRHGDQEIETGVRVGHDEKQRGAVIPDGVQGKLIVFCELPQFLNIKNRKARTAADQYTFCRFAGGHLEFCVLTNGKVFRFLFCQRFKLQINLVLVVFIIFTGIHFVQHVDQRRKILFFRGKLIMDVADQGNVQQRFRFYPEIVAAFTLTLGVGDEHGDELQDILLRMDVGEGVVVHTLLKVDRIEHADIITGCHQHFPGFDNQRALGICDHNGSTLFPRALHDVWLNEKSCFAAAGAADNQDIFVSCVLWILGPTCQRQAFRFGQDDVVPRVRIYERRNIRVGAP